MIFQRPKHRADEPMPAAVAPVLPPRPMRTGGLDDAQRERLALVLHERYHGEHTPERGKVECARISGAFDDVAAIEPVILDMLRGR